MASKKTFIVLLRGVNVGGKNKLPMAALKEKLQDAGFEQVLTYIQSGNVILRSDKSASVIAATIETLLTREFKLDSALIKTLVIEKKTYADIIAAAPGKFGGDLNSHRRDVVFLIDYPVKKAMSEIELRENVDEMWAGKKVIYFQRPKIDHPDATKSKMGKMVNQACYQSLTIRSWNTSRKLLDLLDAEPQT